MSFQFANNQNYVHVAYSWFLQKSNIKEGSPKGNEQYLDHVIFIIHCYFFLNFRYWERLVRQSKWRTKKIDALKLYWKTENVEKVQWSLKGTFDFSSNTSDDS